MRKLPFALAALFLGVSPAAAQISGTDFNTFVSGLTPASAPYGGTDYLPLIRGGASYKVSTNQFALVNGSQTLTNKTIDCNNNTCLNIPFSALSGIIPAANGGTGVANTGSVTIGGNLVTIGGGTLGFGTGTVASLPDGTHELAPLDSPFFSGIPQAPTATTATNTQQLATTAFAHAVVGAVGPHVPTEAALAASATATYPNGVTRDDFAVGVGAPALYYTALTGTCATNGYISDSGWCINTTAGDNNSWLAHLNPLGNSILEWGQITGTSDTALLSTVDTSMGSSGWPAGVAKTLFLPAGNLALGFTLSNGIANIQKIVGAGDYGGTQIVNLAAQGQTGEVLGYVGVGPFEIDDVAFVCATYAAVGAFAEPANCGNWLFLADPASVSTQVSNVRLKRVRIAGGNIGISIRQAQNVDLDIDDIDSTFSHGVVVDDSQNGNGVFTGSVRVHIHKCESVGQYCTTMPVLPSSNALVAAARLTVDIDDCVGAGFINNKGCVDISGASIEQTVFHVRGENSWFEAEVKRIAEATNALPNAFRDIYGEVVGFQNIDSEDCAQISYENPTAASLPDQMANQHYKVTCTFSLPASRQPSIYYPEGAVYSAGGNTYQVIQAGVVASGSGPTGTSTNTGIADGTGIVSYREATPTQSNNLRGVRLFANRGVDIDLSVHGVAFGYQVSPAGSSDNTLRYATLRLRGEVTGNCLEDDYEALFGTNQTADHVTLLDWDCKDFGTSSGSDGSPISLGHKSGSNGTNWTNLQIVGGNIEDLGASAVGALYDQSGTLTGNIIGTRLVGRVSALNLASTGTALSLVGGRFVTTAGSTLGILTSAAGSGTVTLQNINVVNSGAAGVGTVNITGGSLTATGRAFNPPSTGTPTTDCSAHVDLAYGAADDHLYGCTAANTWGALY
jgi:hypothetical protein